MFSTIGQSTVELSVIPHMLPARWQHVIFRVELTQQNQIWGAQASYRCFLRLFLIQILHRFLSKLERLRGDCHQKSRPDC